MVLLQTLLFWNVGVGSNTNSFSSSLISDQPKKKMIGIIFEIFVWIIEISLVLVAIFFHWVGERNRPPAITRERDGDKVHVGGGAGSADAVLYRLHDLEIATNYFSDDNKIGKGGFGVVYKGLLDGQTVAVKKLNGSSVEREFVNEVSLLSSLKHNNLIKLLGFCCEAGNFLLVYEYALNGDLYHYLTDENKRQALNWEIRFEIIKGFARGLSYLHHDSQNPILHRDIKPANVLLDEHHCAKIADFGLSRTFDINKTHKTTKQLAGTMGYIAPELFFNQHFSTRSDVYSYGLLVLETLAGCTVHQYADANEDVLSHVVWKQWKDKKPLTEVIDTYLRDTCPQDQLMSCITIGLLCVQHDPKKRPNMKLVLEMLNNESPLPAPSSPAFFEDHSSTSIQLQCARPPHSSTSIQFSQSTSISSTSNPGLSGNGTTNPCPGSPSFSPPPTYRPPSQPKSEKRKTKSIAALTFAWWRRRRPLDHSFHVPAEEDPEVLLGRLKRFSWRELHVATDEFSNENLLGRGGFGKVYKGRLADGSLIAVKRQREDGNAGGELQFIMERAMTSRAVHRNLLRLCGFCITPTERLLVYPYMANGSLASKLRDRDSNVPPLDWPKRGRIALGAARGLSYLHDSCRPIIIHRDVKAANILLDEDFEAVLGDFGLVKFMDYQDTHVSTAVRGTIGHLAPEYLSTGKVSKKTDVFGYGIMLLELITGQRAFDLVRLANDDDVMLLDWVKRLLKDDRLEMLVDPDLRNNFIKIEVETLIQIALRCTQASPLDRPKMSEVVWMLEVAERWEWQKAPTKLETQLGSNINTDLTCSVSAIQLSGPR